MSKYRVYELAKEFNTDNKNVMRILKEAGREVKNHLAVVEEAARAVVVRALGGVKPAAKGPGASGDKPKSPPKETRELKSLVLL